MNTSWRFAEDHYAGGQPTPAHLAELVREGVRTVINLRAPEEPAEFAEAAEAARLGVHSVSRPIAGAADLDRARVREFGQTLDDARREGGVLIHCGSSNRVGAMIALDATLNRGCSLEAALKRGREAGLATLEPAVVALAEKEGARS